MHKTGSVEEGDSHRQSDPMALGLALLYDLTGVAATSMKPCARITCDVSGTQQALNTLIIVSEF